MEEHKQHNSIVIIAGEVSGDIHGSKLIAALNKADPDLDVQGIGGDLMIREGLKPLFHIKEMSFLGLWEIVKHLPFIKKVFGDMTELVQKIQPKAVILIDYPGFNLRFAKKMYNLGIPVIYYISPQLWAWGKKRVFKIKKYIEKMIVIFPFEKEFYHTYGIDSEYVGHPIADHHFNHVHPKVTEGENITLGLLPGSRRQELESLLPDMIETVQLLKDSSKVDKVYLRTVDTISYEDYKRYLGDDSIIELYNDSSESFYNQLDVALVSSGTATLETGYFKVPMVIVYRVNPITWYLARLLVKVKVIGLVNIVAGENIATELLQNDFSPQKARAELEDLLDPETNALIRDKLSIIKEKLGEPGAAERAARAVFSVISK